MSDKDDRVISKSGIVKNMGVKVEIAASSLITFQLFFFIYGLVAAILNSGNQPTSGNAGSVRNVSSMVVNL